MGNVRSDPLRMPPMLVRGSPNPVCLNASCDCCRYMTARLLGDKDLHIIRAYDKRPPAVQEEQLDDVCLPPPPLPPGNLHVAPCIPFCNEQDARVVQIWR